MRRAIVSLGVLLALGGLGTPGLFAQEDAGPTGQAPPQLQVLGDADFSWELETLDGEEVTLEAFEGRVVFLNLWASWCRPCVAEMASIERLASSLSDTDVAFVMVSPESTRAIERYLRTSDFSLPVHREVQDIPPSFGARGLPTTIVIDRDGQIVLRHHGAAQWDQDSVRNLLRTLDRVPS